MRIKREKASDQALREWLIIQAALLIGTLLLTTLHFCGVHVCLLKRLTGYPCLLCGGTRAAVLLLQGRLAAAFALQPLATLAMILGVPAAIAFFYLLFHKREVIHVSLSRREKQLCLAFALVLALLNWIYLLQTPSPARLKSWQIPLIWDAPNLDLDLDTDPDPGIYPDGTELKL
ncbi:MAG: DUF2752 domain-containing protein [Kiritimatiellia bacterium]